MEVLIFPGVILAVYLWFRSYRVLFKVHQFYPNNTHRTLLAALPVLCMALIVLVLRFKSSPDVRSDVGWMALYFVSGTVWLQLGLFLLSLLGVGAREDVVERQNPAAAWVVYGALIGTTFCYVGSNIGTGPGPEAVFFCAVLSTATLFGFWFLLERIFSLADRITIERDERTGIRAGGWLLSVGLIFGGAVTGDWHSPEGTVRLFFRYGWIASLFLLVAIAIEQTLKSLQMRRNVSRGVSVATALVYFLVAAIYVARWGVH